jgi:hypothetical protein
MNPGDLVELTDLLNHLSDDEQVTIGCVDGNGEISRREFRVGTLAIFLKPYPIKPGAPASVILIDGIPGWVWDDEIRPATHSSHTNANTSMMIPSMEET